MIDGRPSLWEAYSTSRGLPLSSPHHPPSPPPPPPPPPCPPPPRLPPSSPAGGEATRDGEVEVTQLQVEVTLSSPPAALSLAELLWSVERESELELGLSLDGAPVSLTL